MNRSEKLLSTLSEKYFYKSLVYDADSLSFRENGSQEKEFSDMLILIENTIISVQLKSRTDFIETNNEKWFYNKVYCKAHKQHIKTVNYILSQEKIFFSNKSNRTIEINPSKVSDFIFVSVFDCPKLLRYKYVHTEKSLRCLRCNHKLKCKGFCDYNIFSISDFEMVCEELSSPLSFIQYLKFRLLFYKKAEGKFFLTIENDGNVFIVTPGEENSIVNAFLACETPFSIKKSIYSKEFMSFISNCIEPYEEYKHFFNILSCLGRTDQSKFMEIIHVCGRGEKSDSTYLIDDCAILVLSSKHFCEDQVDNCAQIIANKFESATYVLVLLTTVHDDSTYNIQSVSFCKNKESQMLEINQRW